MFGFGKFEWQRTLVAGAGALLLSTTMIAAAAAPVEAAQTCLVVPQEAGTGQVVCSHA
jgi:hypothetical protein